MTLTEFLLARIAEDEALARDAVNVGWVTFRQPDGSMDHTALGTPTEEGWLVDGRLVQDDRAEVFYDPARVLAECAAKRLIVEMHGNELPEWQSESWRVQAALAAVYADHPDYDEAWRP